MGASNEQGPPPPANNQMYVSVTPIPAGHLTLPERFFVTNADPDAKRTVPSFAFLINHPSGGSMGSLSSSSASPGHFRIMFDLGLRRALDRYPEPQQKHLASRQPFSFMGGGFPKLLQSGHVSTQDVQLVILSHVHYDHHGDPEDFPEPTRFAVGAGAMHVLEHGLGGIASHQHFEPGLLPADRSFELPAPPGRKDTQSSGAPVLPVKTSWKALGPFANTLDIYGDGSVYVVDTPGHLPGHVNLLCRLRLGHWVYLAGDACHDRRILTGERDIGTWDNDAGQLMCIHLDKAGAEASISAIKNAMRIWEENGERLEVVLGHDDEWEATNASRMWPGEM